MTPPESSPLRTPEEVLQWLADATLEAQMRVREVPLDQLDRWQFADDRPLRLVHASGQFFSIVGIRHRGTFGSEQHWDQPMIDQPEVGILGFLTKSIENQRCVLVQAKIEPGNSTGAQLAPTFQATRSNYTKVHGGRIPPYLDQFQTLDESHVWGDQLQSEQASRFLYKRNRNMLVEATGPVTVLPGFRWVPWRLLCDLLRLNSIVNMDARSVLSCVPPPQIDAPQASELDRILRWFTGLRANFPRRTTIVGLDEMAEWSISKSAIHRPDGRFFSVVGVDVEMRGREVAKWSQPLLKHHGRGLNALIAQRFGGNLRFLIRACCYPGSVDNFELGSTVSLSDYESRIGDPKAPAFFEYVNRPGIGKTIHASLQCEEGGRFLNYENQYTVVELDEGLIQEVPPGFIWMTMGEIYALLPHGYFSIEARNLLACLHGVF